MTVSEVDRALFISPHTDDSELCCGGTIRKLVDSGVVVTIYSCGLATNANVGEQALAAEELGALAGSWRPTFPTRQFHLYRQEILEAFRTLAKEEYDLVFIPSMRDTHQDHQTVAEEAFRAFKFGTILSWETPWNNLDFSPNFYCSFGEGELSSKLRSVNRYVSQRHRHYFKEDYLRGWATMRGGQVGKQYAEAYEVVRILI